MNIKKNVLNEVMHLKPQEKFFLIELLVTSLDRPDKGINAIWLEEAQKRLKAHRSGLTRKITANKILK
jgi:hypothetical protein